MQKDISLWSINDYTSLIQKEDMNLAQFWKERLDHIKIDPFNSFITISEDLSINQTENLPLSNVPIPIKDNMCYKKFPTTCGSKMLSEWIPDYNATIVSLLEKKGSMIIGKTNLDEFAMGNTTGTGYFGKTFNPWDSYKRFSPGGSSGGSAVAVAMGYSPVAIGSDTGGSIRCPASFCGIIGLKPTYGRVSRYGLVSYAHTLDQIGVLGRYAPDVSNILEIISQPDKKDMTYKNKPYKHQDLKIEKEIVVGIPYSSFEIIPSDQKKIIMDALNLLEQKGFIELRPIELEDLEILLPTYYVTAFSEAYSNLVRYSGQQYGFDAGDILTTRLEGFGEEIQRRFNLGSYSLKTGFEEQLYSKSQKIREFYKEKFKELFKEVEVIALPTMLDVAFTWDEIHTPVDSYKADLLTVPANLIGIPGISIPVGFSKKHDVSLPVGLQLNSKWWNESKLLQLAFEYQQITNNHLILPPEPIKELDSIS